LWIYKGFCQKYFVFNYKWLFEMLLYMGTLAQRVTARRLELRDQKRDNANWSQAYVARKIENDLKLDDPKATCSQQAYQAVEKGKSNNPAFLLELAAALYTTTDWLKHGKGDKESPLTAMREAVGEPSPPLSGKSPKREALALHDRILALCEAVSIEAQVYVDVDQLALDMREILNQVPKQHKPPLKKSTA
jgi:transcriptional regulator with XRE-family HTH domain